MKRNQHLQQLLNEEQEPFVLNNFINERRYLRKRSHPEEAHDSGSVLPTIKRSKSGENSSFSDRCCLNFRSAFLSSSSSVESPFSPLKLDLHSEHHHQLSQSSSTIRNFLELELANSSVRKKLKKHSSSSNRLTESLIHSFRHSLSINKRSSSSSNLKRSSSSSSNSSSSFKLFRSIIKRLIPAKSQSSIKIRSLNKYNPNAEIENRNRKISDKRSQEKNKVSFGLGFSSSSTSSAWSESDENENRSVDLESNSSGSDDDGEFERVAECSGELHSDDESNADTSSSTKLATEPCCNGDDSLGTCRLLTEYQSPAASPSLRETEMKGHIFASPSTNGSSASIAGEGYQDKEQFSPVSVLEPPFEDEGFEYNFANVQRLKQQLSNKLRRFERLVELGPLKLEQRMAEEEEENEVDIAESLAREILNGSSCHCPCLLPAGMVKLVRDLIEEESGDESNLDLLVPKIGQRIGNWKTVVSNTIDMMVEMDLKRDAEKWGSHGDQVKETATEIEIAIFGFLLDELSFDLSRSSC